MIDYDWEREQRHGQDSSGQPAGWTQSGYPGKRTLTMSLPARSGNPPARSGNPPAQRKRAPALPAVQMQRAEETAGWMAAAMRPDLNPAPVQRSAAGEVTGQDLPSDGGGRAMPEDVQAKMESAFGADFSAVRIHQGPRSQALGAQAYTQGTDIHFAPGEYQPSSQSGQALLGHELAHVVQQSQGRVQATAQAKGVGINDDAGLEREADEMGARAARGEKAGTGVAASTASAGAASVVQCNVGVEVEMGSWDVKKGGERIGKREPVVTGTSTELQGENNGASSSLEFVTKGEGASNIAEFRASLREIVKLALKLKRFPKDKSFLASKIGGGKEYQITSPGMVNAFLQATVGIPLSRVPTLFAELDRSTTKPGYQEAIDGGRKRSQIAGDVLEREVSPELTGFLSLLMYYIKVGEQKKANFPKALTSIMARTDFHTMYTMLPEYDDKHPTALAKSLFTILGRFGVDLGRLVFTTVFQSEDTPGQDKPYVIELTIGDWVLGFPERDRLVKPIYRLIEEGKLGAVTTGPPETPGMGSFGSKIDKVQVAGAMKESSGEEDMSSGEMKSITTEDAPIFELRALPSLGFNNPMDWYKKAMSVYAMVDRINGSPEGPFDAEDMARETTQLETTLESEIQAEETSFLTAVATHPATYIGLSLVMAGMYGLWTYMQPTDQ